MNPLHNPLLITAFVLLWIYGLCYLLARRSLRKTEIISKQTLARRMSLAFGTHTFGKRPRGVATLDCVCRHTLFGSCSLHSDALDTVQTGRNANAESFSTTHFLRETLRLLKFQELIASEQRPGAAG